MCLVAICVSFLLKLLFRSFAYFFIVLFYYWVWKGLYSEHFFFFCQLYGYKYFLLVCGLPFHSFHCVFERQEVFFYSDKVQLIFFFLLVTYLKKKSLPTQDHKGFSIMFSFWSFIDLGFTFRSMVCFELIFGYDVQCGQKFSFFSTCVFNCFSTICWKDCILSTK